MIELHYPILKKIFHFLLENKLFFWLRRVLNLIPESNKKDEIMRVVDFCVANKNFGEAMRFATLLNEPSRALELKKLFHLCKHTSLGDAMDIAELLRVSSKDESHITNMDLDYLFEECSKEGLMEECEKIKALLKKTFSREELEHISENCIVKNSKNSVKQMQKITSYLLSQKLGQNNLKPTIFHYHVSYCLQSKDKNTFGEVIVEFDKEFTYKTRKEFRENFVSKVKSEGEDTNGFKVIMLGYRNMDVDSNQN